MKTQEKRRQQTIKGLIRAGYSEKLACAIAKYSPEKFRLASRFAQERRESLQRGSA